MPLYRQKQTWFTLMSTVSYVASFLTLHPQTQYATNSSYSVTPTVHYADYTIIYHHTKAFSFNKCTAKAHLSYGDTTCTVSRYYTANNHERRNLVSPLKVGGEGIFTTFAAKVGP